MCLLHMWQKTQRYSLPMWTRVYMYALKRRTRKIADILIDTQKHVKNTIKDSWCTRFFLFQFRCHQFHRRPYLFLFINFSSTFTSVRSKRNNRILQNTVHMEISKFKARLNFEIWFSRKRGHVRENFILLFPLMLRRKIT